ncbi:hypothetical protein ACWGHM_37060 [Streptomyces sp. NPDC054904]
MPRGLMAARDLLPWVLAGSRTGYPHMPRLSLRALCVVLILLAVGAAQLHKELTLPLQDRVQRDAEEIVLLTGQAGPEPAAG